jgi:surface antigen
VLSNLVVLAVIMNFVLQKPPANNTAPGLLNSSATTAAADPLDQVSSADIALTVARLGSLPETTAITNQAQSQAAEVAITASANNVVSKPQVVATTLKSRADIQDYTAVAGDTVSSIASKFGVTSDSIRWSNGLNTDAVNPGTNLAIPPVNGIVYTVKGGDTADSLAAKYRSNKDKIVAYNDAEINGLQAGQRIIIPDAVDISPVSATKIALAASSTSSWGGPSYGYNGYDYGYCTWYVATQIAVPNNWGNAATWAYYASRSGWNVSSAPTVGSVAQTAAAAGGLGHVAIVTKVSDDGTQIQIRDMNGVAGFGRVGYSDWKSASSFQHYISR